MSDILTFLPAALALISLWIVVAISVIYRDLNKRLSQAGLLGVVYYIHRQYSKGKRNE